MDNSSLNASHRYARQANKFFRNARFDEAILNHEMARQKIEETMNSLVCTSPKVLESLRLQKMFHSKQIDLIILRREQHEKLLAIQTAVDQGLTFRNNLEDSRQVQVELFRSLDNVEKVVEVLEQKTLHTGNKEASEFLSKLFEDLKVLNQQNLQMVQRLVSQLDERISENEDLRETMEESRETGSSLAKTNSVNSQKRKELSDSDTELNKLEDLPPLGLPSFDFGTLSSSPSLGQSDEGSGGSSSVEAVAKESATLKRIGFSSLEEEENPSGSLG